MTDREGRNKPQSFRFTKKKLAEVPAPAQGRVTVHDEGQPGLTLRITAAGSRTFYFYKKIRGKPVRLKLGTFPELTIEQARNLTVKTLQAYAEGQDPARQRQEGRHDRTLGQVRQQYVDQAELSPRTTVSEDSLWDTTLKPWGGRRLSDITPAAVNELAQRIRKKRGGRTANRAVSYLRRLFRYAESVLGFEGRDPTRAYKPTSESSRARFLEADELQAFIREAEAEGQPWTDWFKLALLTGARSGNLRRMRWDQIDLKRANWTIPANESKSGRSIVIPLVEEATAILKRRQDERNGEIEYVFPVQRNMGTNPYIGQPHRPFRRICERAGITDLRIHDLRRTAGAVQANLGASLLIIGQALGHHNQRATQIYARLSEDPVRASMQAAAATMMRSSDEGDGAGQNDELSKLVENLSDQQRRALKRALEDG